MKYSILLMIITLSGLFSPEFDWASYSDCMAIEATVKTTKPTDNMQNGEITILAKGGKGDLHYFFFNEKGRPINSTNEEQNVIKSLGKGIYKCSVVDQEGCIKQLVIELN